MRHFVFDLDGTLIDSHSTYFEAIAQVFSKFGANFTNETKKEVIKIPVRARRDFFAKYVGEANADRAIEMLDDDLIARDQSTEIFTGAKELLENLRSKNRKIALWTARDLESAKRVIEQSGLAPYFDFYMSGTCVTNCKPDPEGLMRIAHEFGCDPSELSMIGDHDNDMLAAKSCGAFAIRAFWNAGASQSDTRDACPLSNIQFSKIESLDRWLNETLN